MIWTKSVLALASLTVRGAGAFFAFRSTPTPQAAGESVQAAFALPEPSAEAQEGQRYFHAVCAVCHGPNGMGTEQRTATGQ